MCGIAGFIRWQAGDKAELQSAAQAMAQRLIHRGPDDEGVWIEATHSLALAHRRLSILDLSSHGHQPMVSASGRYTLCYNGEIYNFRTLRDALDYPWQSESDTEVILAAIEAWGIEHALTRLEGMFAFALWDAKEARLTLARDRMGEKPLYYGKVGRQLAFASEAKAFGPLPGWQPSINRDALGHYLRYSYVPAPHSIYEHLFKLSPGCFIHFDEKSPFLAQEQTYWSFEQTMLAGLNHPLTAEPEELVDELERLLSNAVSRQMVSDVPIGAFLSGGIDSSLISALMQSHSAGPINSFTIGFSEDHFNEAPHAREVARHLGTHHTEHYVSPEEAREVIPQLPHIYDEPFADSSQIPTLLVSRLARQHVTVALSGDGGDELFGGYNRHLRGPHSWNRLKHIPLPLRTLLGKLGMTLPAGLLNLFIHRQPEAAGKWRSYAEKLGCASAEEFYQMLCSVHSQTAPYLAQSASPLTSAKIRHHDRLDYAGWMMAMDSISYLPGDILTKVDRAAMAVSLETRIPMLDPAVIAFAWRVPMAHKIRQGQGKWLLKKLLYRHVPQKLIDRPKAGFGVPIGRWLNGPLRDWAEDLLAEDRLARQGYWHSAMVQRCWREHQSGTRNHASLLWNILIFQSWLDHQAGGNST
jgi:asparagine synthase (glutamine-hydrolysing)